MDGKTYVVPCRAGVTLRAFHFRILNDSVWRGLSESGVRLGRIFDYCGYFGKIWRLCWEDLAVIMRKSCGVEGEWGLKG